MNTSRRSTQLFLIMAFMLALCLVFLAACEKPEAASDATSDDEAAASTAEDEGSSAADSAADSADTAGRTFYVDNEGEIHNAPGLYDPYHKFTGHRLWADSVNFHPLRRRRPVAERYRQCR